MPFDGRREAEGVEQDRGELRRDLPRPAVRSAACLGGCASAAIAERSCIVIEVSVSSSWSYMARAGWLRMGAP
jgi:hypothetical protein